MIQSVSTLAFGNGAAITSCSTVNFGIPPTAGAGDAGAPVSLGACVETSSSSAGCGKEMASVVNILEEVTLGAAFPLVSAFPKISRTSVSLPKSAAAAAIPGVMRCVRPPGPWRPSKFRLEVDAQRSCGARRSGFMPRHMEQPGSRQSKPASTKILSRPSASACCLTRPEPGTIIASTPDATFCPEATMTLATSRMSSIRLLVQEPMKAFCIVTSVIFMPASRPM
mmetsp:Transcript_97614/g.183523  ORF Transcript_97614/g.183523 Transcript_97614/m.183523 type:complete len:225 (-) Transcript_97614:1006-1680(-)